MQRRSCTYTQYTYRTDVRSEIQNVKNTINPPWERDNVVRKKINDINYLILHPQRSKQAIGFITIPISIFLCPCTFVNNGKNVMTFFLHKSGTEFGLKDFLHCLLSKFRKAFGKFGTKYNLCYFIASCVIINS